MNDFRYALHGVTLGLAWFGVVNVIAAALVITLADRTSRRGAIRPPAFWLSVRLFPAAASTLFVAVLFAPSYWQYEPRPVEDFDITVTALALAVVVVLAAGCVRACVAWARAAHRARAWLEFARPLHGRTAMRVYEVPIDAPVMALAGVLRPRVLVSSGVVRALTRDELRAAVAHEIGHLRAWDNLKRLAMRAAPDVLAATRTVKTIEARWAAAAEHAADRAAGDDSERRCALASALVKVARLTPVPTPLAEPISTLVDGGDIASRVERLLADDSPASPCLSVQRVSATLAAGGLFLVGYAPLLRIVHEATELVVNSLP